MDPWCTSFTMIALMLHSKHSKDVCDFINNKNPTDDMIEELSYTMLGRSDNNSRRAAEHALKTFAKYHRIHTSSKQKKRVLQYFVVIKKRKYWKKVHPAYPLARLFEEKNKN